MRNELHDEEVSLNETDSATGAIFAAGFNAHSQLRSDSTEDVRELEPVSSESGAQHGNVLFASWSSTVFTVPGTVTSLGFTSFTQAIDRNPETNTLPVLRDAIGDTHGIQACLDEDGDLYVQAEPGEALLHATTDASPALKCIAMALTGRVAVTVKQAPNGRLCHILEFADFEHFITWYRDPSGETESPPEHYMLPGRPKQMVANIATFITLMEDGKMYTWGDPRLRSLGRPIHGEGAYSAEKPGLVAALDGLDITKIACGGWLSAALSKDGAMYIWGAAAPGSEHSIKCLREAEAGEVVLVEIMSTGAEPLDIIDVAVGDHHIAAVSEDNRLFVVGDNENGQLGLGSPSTFFEDWTEVPSLSKIDHTVCGPKSTFAFTLVHDS